MDSQAGSPQVGIVSFTDLAKIIVEIKALTGFRVRDIFVTSWIAILATRKKGARSAFLRVRHLGLRNAGTCVWGN